MHLEKLSGGEEILKEKETVYVFNSREKEREREREWMLGICMRKKRIMVFSRLWAQEQTLPDFRKKDELLTFPFSFR